jgi:hypothetical protein
MLLRTIVRFLANKARISGIRTVISVIAITTFKAIVAVTRFIPVRSILITIITIVVIIRPVV